MGELIGAKLHAAPEDREPTPEEIKDLITHQRAFNGLLYEVSIDKLTPEQAEWAEADVVVAIDENDIVLGYEVVRVSVDNNLLVKYGSADDEEVDFFDWIREVAAWAHAVPRMKRWVWFHIHPEGMATPSSNDEQKVTLINAADLLAVGHLGGPRCFQSFIVVQRNGIIALQSDDVNGIGPKEDALTSRIYADSYARVLGVSHPLTVAMEDISAAIEGFAERWTGNPIEMLMFGMSDLMPLQAALHEARKSVDGPEMQRLLREDYEANGPLDPSAPRAERPNLGFRPPTPTGDLPELGAGILADLASFNFDTLDGASS